MHQTRTNVFFFLALGAFCTRAAAHTGVGDPAELGFWAGFLHPITGIDHLAVMVAVGVWSALSARRAGLELLWNPLGFATMLLAGALAGLQGAAVPAVEPMIAASLLATGLLVMCRWRAPAVVGATLVGAFAVFHGVAHGVELAGSASAASTLAGMLGATVLLHLSGLGLGWLLRSAHVWLPRAMGAGVAVFGLGLLAHMA